MSARLNDSGEMLFTRIVRGGAVHVSRAERTLAHAHYAWKIVVGLDAPVWFRSGDAHIRYSDGAFAIVVPPGLHHEVGAAGWTCTLFGAPGWRETSWRTDHRHWVPGSSTARRLVSISQALLQQTRLDTEGLTDEAFRAIFAKVPRTPVDARVERALRQLRAAPGASIHQLASAQRLSEDRLSHLVKQGTGLTLRKHLVWSRLMGFLSTGERYGSIASAARAAGFSDHAHMTRTYRSYLGRLPSEFSGPPDVVHPW